MMPYRFAHLAQRLFNTPLAIAPHKAEIILAALAERLGITSAARADGSELLLERQEIPAERAAPHAYEVVEGVAIIPIEGTLVQKLGTLRPYSGMTGYDGIRQNIAVALEDPSVRAVVLDIESPGGEVAGCFDLVDEIYSARGRKPMWSILSETAYSAAYAIASATDRIVVPRTGGVGSIGVIWMHVDFERALGEAGINVTFVQYGAKKAWGNQYQALPEAARAEFQSQIDEAGDLFVETVARNRGLTFDAVRDTQAGMFQGADGVDVGLADAVTSPREAFSALLDELG